MGIPFGRYELLKRIAAGGMGEVFLARQAGLEGFEKLLVVKVLLPHLAEDSEFTTMFLDEARIAARLNHPNIGQIFDLGEVDGAYYIAMEYIHGDDVVRLWKTSRAKDKPVSLPLAVRIAADAAAGLDYAHKAVDSNNRPLNLVHRDVSPQNILITFDGGVKLIDFGIAKAAGRMSHTATGTLKGKYSYMSPEQAAGRDIDRRSDIFALGVVLYEMATSVRLFKRDTELATLRAVSECEIPRPSEVNPAIDAQLEAVLLKMLATKPEERQPDCQAVRLALEEWLVETRQPGSAAHLAAFMQDLYSDRLADERADGKPFCDFEGTPSALFRRSMIEGTVRASAAEGSRSGVRPAPEGAQGGVWAAPGQPAEPAAPAPKKLPIAAIGAGVAALVMAAVLAVVLLGKQEAPPVQPVAAPQLTASLSVATRPAGARVVLDGKEVGVTPLDGFPLTAGRHVQLELALDGYKTVRKAIPALGAQNLDLVLEPEAPEPAPQPAAPAEVVLTVTSKPAGATVRLGDEVLGKTPLAVRRPKSEEALTFEFRLTGYKPATRSSSANGDAEVEAVLTKASSGGSRPGPLDIKTGR